MIPLTVFYALISALGTVDLWRQRHGSILVVLIALLLAVNYGDFLRYYWFVYPKTAREWFSKNDYQSYQILSQESEKRKLTPAIEKAIYSSQGENAHFFEAVFFSQPLLKWDSSIRLSDNILLMSQRKEIPGFRNLGVQMPDYYLHISRSIKQ